MTPEGPSDVPQAVEAQRILNRTTRSEHMVPIARSRVPTSGHIVLRLEDDRIWVIRSDATVSVLEFAQS